ncbi:hypothetical protein ABBQ32_012748 [Trebouxia sp. C0010 RCD-2024]
MQAETADMSQLEESIQKWQRAAHKAQRHADACHAEANAKDEEAAEATAQAEAAQQEAEQLVDDGRHTDAEAATAAAQRWLRRAAKAKGEGDAARAEGDAKVEEARDASAQAAQVKDSMQQQEQAAKAPLQQPLRQQSVCSSPKQASNLSEKRSLCAAAATNTEHGSFADLSKEAADAKYKAALAQEEAQQLQGAGHFAEAAALSSAAHKWRKKSAKAHRVMEGAGMEGNDSQREVLNSAQAGHFDASSPPTQPHAVPDWLSSPRRAPGSKRVSSESSSPALPLPGLSGHADRADSISPGSLHRLNVFSAPGTRHISSEGSGDGVPTRAEGEAEDALRQELYQQQRADVVLPQQTAHQELSGPSHLLDEAAQWAKRNTKALKLARRAQEAAAASEQEAAAAAEEAKRASWQAESAESEGIEDEQSQALRLVASKWTKRAGKAQRAAARARAEAEAQQAEATQAAQLAMQAAEAHAQAEARAQADAAARTAATAADKAAQEAATAADTAAKVPLHHGQMCMCTWHVARYPVYASSHCTFC